MSLANMHPEDVKAQLRKRFGSIFEFERANGIPNKTVSEHLRGRPRRGVAELIENALKADSSPPSDLSEHSDVGSQAHYPKNTAL